MRYRFFKAHLKAAGVRYRGPGQCRHTYASQLLTTGVASVDWIAEQMGHTSANMIRQHYGMWINEDGPDVSAYCNTPWTFSQNPKWRGEFAWKILEKTPLSQKGVTAFQIWELRTAREETTLNSTIKSSSRSPNQLLGVFGPNKKLPLHRTGSTVTARWKRLTLTVNHILKTTLLAFIDTRIFGVIARFPYRFELGGSFAACLPNAFTIPIPSHNRFLSKCVTAKRHQLGFG